MKRTVRPSMPSDAQGIAALFAQVGLWPNVDQRHLHWKYWQARADWLGPRSFVLASEDEVIAHGAIIPGSYTWGSGRVSTIHVIDWFARRDEAGAGVAVVKHIGHLAQSLLAINGSAETRRILPHLGFRPSGVVTDFVRPLFPLRLLRSDGIPWWRRWPRFARSVIWTLAAPSSRMAGWEVRRLVGEDINRIASVLPAPTRGMAVLNRSVDLFRYVLSCPIVPMALFAVERSGHVRGYFLLAYPPGQVRIADCWIDSDELADWRALILCAVEQARHDPQAAEVEIWASDPLLDATLRTCGFHARSEIPIQLRTATAGAMPPASLRVQMLDNDEAYLHAGRPEFRA